jgi:hypothetical protein
VSSGLDVVIERRIDHDELRSDSVRLSREPLAVLTLQMTVEEAGEQPFEGVVGKGQVQRVAADQLGPRHPPACQFEHRSALVERGDLSREVLRQVAGAAGDVERSRGREGF